MAKNEKSQAELYREERKARLAKAAKKNSKKSISSQASKTAGKIIAVVLVLAVLAGVGTIVFKQSGVVQKGRTALVIAGEKVSQAEYGYYYMGTYNNCYSYAQYGYNIGLDTTVSPATQEYSNTMGEIENFPEDQTPMWTDYFEYAAKENLQYIKGACAEAKKLGIELTDKDKAQVEDTIQQYKDYANSAGGENSTYSLSAWLKQNYGSGMSEKLLKKIVEEQQLATALQNAKTEEYKKSYTEKQVNKEYKEHEESFGAITFRSYTVAAEKVTSKDEDGEEKSAVTDATMKAAKAVADKIAAASSESSFNALVAQAAKDAGVEGYEDAVKDDSLTLTKDAKYETLSQSVSDEDFLEWAFDDDASVGSTYIVENKDTGYTVYMMVDPLHKPAAYDTYDSRHILINFKETEDKEDEEAKDTDKDTKTEEVKVETLDVSKYDVKVDLAVNAETAKDKAAYKDAQDVLEKYLKGDHTEDAFAALAEEYSADTGSNTKGGLYEGTAAGQFVPPYENFCLAEGRNSGDIGLVEYEGSNYSGYHIIYYVGKTIVTWDEAVKTSLAQEELNEYIEEFVHSKDYAVADVNEKAISSVESFLVDAVKNAARNSAKQSSYGY